MEGNAPSISPYQSDVMLFYYIPLVGVTGFEPARDFSPRFLRPLAKPFAYTPLVLAAGVAPALVWF